MVKRELPLILTVLIGVVFLFSGIGDTQASSGPDLEELEEDIQAVSLQIREAKKENAQYAGGLVKSLIILRLQILKNTKAMLEQKKHALEHRIPVEYTYKGEVYQPTPADKTTIQDLESDIRDQEIELSKAEAENAKYSGGLVKAMILSQIATIKNTIAMLEQRKLTAKFGIPLFTPPKEQLKGAREEEKLIGVTPSISKAETETEEDLSKGYTFRKTAWGMSKEEVKRTEVDKILHDTEKMLVYEGSIARLGCGILYIFAEGKLVRAKYVVTEEHSNENDYISDYNSLKEGLTKKYGQPIVDEHYWKRDLYKDDPQRWGFAISIGHLSYFAKWGTLQTNIVLGLFGDNYDITLAIEYQSKELKELEKEEKEKELLEKF